jgi:ATP-dependent Clp protease ATP-binding subunit ClpC
VFERFSAHARQVVVFAQEEARALHHRDIGVEHLLLGVARVAPSLLSEDVDALRESMGRRRAPEVTQPLATLPFTRHAQASLTRAYEEMGFRSHAHVLPAHLILGLLEAAPQAVASLVRDVDGVGARALQLAAQVPQQQVPEDVVGALRAGRPCR